VALNISPFSRKPNPNLTLTLNNDTIDVSNSAKYLVVIVDDQLSFQCHISFLEKKLSCSVGLLAKLSYYLPFDTLLTLYHTLVYTHLLYALPVWATTYPTYLNKLKNYKTNV